MTDDQGTTPPDLPEQPPDSELENLRSGSRRISRIGSRRNAIEIDTPKERNTSSEYRFAPQVPLAVLRPELDASIVEILDEKENARHTAASGTDGEADVEAQHRCKPEDADLHFRALEGVPFLAAESSHQAKNHGRRMRPPEKEQQHLHRATATTHSSTSAAREHANFVEAVVASSSGESVDEYTKVYMRVPSLTVTDVHQHHSTKTAGSREEVPTAHDKNDHKDRDRDHGEGDMTLSLLCAQMDTLNVSLRSRRFLDRSTLSGKSNSQPRAVAPTPHAASFNHAPERNGSTFATSPEKADVVLDLVDALAFSSRNSVEKQFAEQAVKAQLVVDPDLSPLSKARSSLGGSQATLEDGEQNEVDALILSVEQHERRITQVEVTALQRNIAEAEGRVQNATLEADVEDFVQQHAEQEMQLAAGVGTNKVAATTDAVDLDFEADYFKVSGTGEDGREDERKNTSTTGRTDDEVIPGVPRLGPRVSIADALGDNFLNFDALARSMEGEGFDDVENGAGDGGTAALRRDANSTRSTHYGVLASVSRRLSENEIRRSMRAQQQEQQLRRVRISEDSPEFLYSPDGVLLSSHNTTILGLEPDEEGELVGSVVSVRAADGTQQLVLARLSENESMPAYPRTTFEDLLPVADAPASSINSPEPDGEGSSQSNLGDYEQAAAEPEAFRSVPARVRPRPEGESGTAGAGGLVQDGDDHAPTTGGGATTEHLRQEPPLLHPWYVLEEARRKNLAQFRRADTVDDFLTRLEGQQQGSLQPFFQQEQDEAVRRQTLPAEARPAEARPSTTSADRPRSSTSTRRRSSASPQRTVVNVIEQKPPPAPSIGPQGCTRLFVPGGRSSSFLYNGSPAGTIGVSASSSAGAAIANSPVWPPNPADLMRPLNAMSEMHIVLASSPGARKPQLSAPMPPRLSSGKLRSGVFKQLDQNLNLKQFFAVSMLHTASTSSPAGAVGVEPKLLDSEKESLEMISDALAPPAIVSLHKESPSARPKEDEDEEGVVTKRHSRLCGATVTEVDIGPTRKLERQTVSAVSIERAVRPSDDVVLIAPSPVDVVDAGSATSATDEMEIITGPAAGDTRAAPVVVARPAEVEATSPQAAAARPALFGSTETVLMSCLPCVFKSGDALMSSSKEVVPDPDARSAAKTTSPKRASGTGAHVVARERQQRQSDTGDSASAGNDGKTKKNVTRLYNKARRSPSAAPREDEQRQRSAAGTVVARSHQSVTSSAMPATIMSSAPPVAVPAAEQYDVSPSSPQHKHIATAVFSASTPLISHPKRAERVGTPFAGESLKSRQARGMEAEAESVAATDDNKAAFVTTEVILKSYAAAAKAQEQGTATSGTSDGGSQERRAAKHRLVEVPQFVPGPVQHPVLEPRVVAFGSHIPASLTVEAHDVHSHQQSPTIEQAQGAQARQDQGQGARKGMRKRSGTTTFESDFSSATSRGGGEQRRKDQSKSASRGATGTGTTGTGSSGAPQTTQVDTFRRPSRESRARFSQPLMKEKDPRAKRAAKDASSSNYYLANQEGTHSFQFLNSSVSTDFLEDTERAGAYHGDSSFIALRDVIDLPLVVNKEPQHQGLAMDFSVDAIASSEGGGGNKTPEEDTRAPQPLRLRSSRTSSPTPQVRRAATIVFGDKDRRQLHDHEHHDGQKDDFDDLLADGLDDAGWSPPARPESTPIAANKSRRGPSTSNTFPSSTSSPSATGSAQSVVVGEQALVPSSRTAEKTKTSYRSLKLDRSTVPVAYVEGQETKEPTGQNTLNAPRPGGDKVSNRSMKKPDRRRRLGTGRTSSEDAKRYLADPTASTPTPNRRIILEGHDEDSSSSSSFSGEIRSFADDDQGGPGEATRQETTAFAVESSSSTGSAVKTTTASVIDSATPNSATSNRSSATSAGAAPAATIPSIPPRQYEGGHAQEATFSSASNNTGCDPLSSESDSNQTRTSKSTEGAQALPSPFRPQRRSKPGPPPKTALAELAKALAWRGPSPTAGAVVAAAPPPSSRTAPAPAPVRIDRRFEGVPERENIADAVKELADSPPSSTITTKGVGLFYPESVSLSSPRSSERSAAASEMEPTLTSIGIRVGDAGVTGTMVKRRAAEIEDELRQRKSNSVVDSRAGATRASGPQLFTTSVGGSDGAPPVKVPVTEDTTLSPAALRSKLKRPPIFLADRRASTRKKCFPQEKKKSVSFAPTTTGAASPCPTKSGGGVSASSANAKASSTSLLCSTSREAGSSYLHLDRAAPASWSVPRSCCCSQASNCRSRLVSSTSSGGRIFSARDDKNEKQRRTTNQSCTEALMMGPGVVPESAPKWISAAIDRKCGEARSTGGAAPVWSLSSTSSVFLPLSVQMIERLGLQIRSEQPGTSALDASMKVLVREAGSATNTIDGDEEEPCSR